jgi:hypothetical protein
MFVRVINTTANDNGDQTRDVALGVISYVEDENYRQSRIVTSCFTPSVSSWCKGIFRSPHSSQQVRRAINLFAGFLAGERQSLLDLPMSNTPLGDPQRVSGWTLDLSEANGIRVIETTANVDANGDWQSEDGTSIRVERARSSAKPSIPQSPRL